MLKFVFFLFIPFMLFASLSQEHLKALHHSIDPLSISKQLAFYHLYPETEEGKKALDIAFSLLTKHQKAPIPLQEIVVLPHITIDPMIQMVNGLSDSKDVHLEESQLEFINQLAAHLPNRALLGSQVWDKQQLYSLDSSQIDLARGILLYQFDGDKRSVMQYEASIDLMALQIMARLEKNASDLDKIKAINHFIFHEMGFRFPPHSLWAKDIDLYTFLPSVLDSRQGVCLGVSILYLCIAQRLDLPLDIITPVGHIYLSYSNDDQLLNIETTARGVHVETLDYYGVNTKDLCHRTMKEVIGLNFINQASVCLHKKKYSQAIELYLEAKRYLVDDYLVNQLLCYTYFLHDEQENALALLAPLLQQNDPYVLHQDPLLQDLKEKRSGKESLEAIFMEVDETYESILEKQEKLKIALTLFPNCFESCYHLGITYLQLSRTNEALETFERCFALKQDQPSVLYYLTLLSMERNDFPKAKYYLDLLTPLMESHQRKKQIIYPMHLTIAMHFSPKPLEQ